MQEANLEGTMIHSDFIILNFRCLYVTEVVMINKQLDT